MSAKDAEPTEGGPSETAKWDPEVTKRAMAWFRPIAKGYHRSEVHGLGSFPPGGALVVSNHSGGMFAIDVAIFATGFYDHFGYERPIYTLSHDLLFKGPTGEFFTRLGFIHANHANSDEALRSGGVVVVFPGGDYDAFRPTASANTIDFAGRTGYVKAAINAGVPIVPVVSIGAQENQLYLSRGTGLARALKVDKLLRLKYMPVTVGFPFGVSAILPINLPLPTKITTQVLEPIDLEKQFGADPDVADVDAHVRQLMQTALDALARKRRFPILG